MAYTKPDEGDTILHTHITQLTNALDGTADAGEPIQATEVDDATHYAVDARNKNATGLHFRLRNTAGEDMMKAALSTLTFYKNIVVAANITIDGVDIGAHTHDGSDSQALAADSVNATMIAAGAVHAAELATNAVSSVKIAASAVESSKLATGAVTNAKFRDAVGPCVIGRSAEGDGDVADIVGVANDRVLARASDTLAFQQVSTAMIAADAVDDTIVGSRVPQFYRRQGGSATDWNTAGATTVAPGAVRMQAGAIQWTGAAQPFGNIEITFPVAFSYQPLVFASTVDLEPPDLILGVRQPSPPGVCELSWQSITNATYTAVNLYWLAIGPE